MDVMNKLRGVRRSVAVKSGELAESSKLTFNIKRKEREIRALELEIGKRIYDAYKNGHTFTEEVSSQCQKIDAAYTEIARMEADREKVGLDDLDVEVVDIEAEIPEDEDFEVSEEDDEILREL